MVELECTKRKGRKKASAVVQGEMTKVESNIFVSILEKHDTALHI